LAIPILSGNDVIALTHAARFDGHGTGPTVSLDEVRECLAGISAGTDRVREVIRRVRTLTKKAPVHMVPIQINEVIEQALVIARQELLERQTIVRTRLSSALPAVSADPIQLQQVLLNLIINAVQAMSATPPERRQLQIQSGLKDDSVVVVVEDSGSGLSPEIQERLFTPFYRARGCSDWSTRHARCRFPHQALWRSGAAGCRPAGADPRSLRCAAKPGEQHREEWCCDVTTKVFRSLSRLLPSSPSSMTTRRFESPSAA
jgi:hypothetical protein